MRRRRRKNEKGFTVHSFGLQGTKEERYVNENYIHCEICRGLKNENEIIGKAKQMKPVRTTSLHTQQHHNPRQGGQLARKGHQGRYPHQSHKPQPQCRPRKTQAPTLLRQHNPEHNSTHRQEKDRDPQGPGGPIPTACPTDAKYPTPTRPHHAGHTHHNPRPHTGPYPKPQNSPTPPPQPQRKRQRTPDPDETGTTY
jgi:hypothetical protein